MPFTCNLSDKFSYKIENRFIEQINNISIGFICNKKLSYFHFLEQMSANYTTTSEREFHHKFSNEVAYDIDEETSNDGEVVFF